MPFTWLFVLGFWMTYIIIGLVVCVFYLRVFAPKVYKVVSGDCRIDSDGAYRVKTGKNWYYEPSVDRIEIFLSIIVGLLFWPLVLVFGVGYFFVKYSSKTLFKIMVSAVGKVAKKVPEVMIKKAKPEDS